MSGGASRAFARAKAMMAVISAVIAQGLQPLAQQSALNDLGLEYKSRGKGKGRWGGHKYNARLNRKSTLHTVNGAREVARRQRQIAQGRISPVSYRTF